MTSPSPTSTANAQVPTSPRPSDHPVPELHHPEYFTFPITHTVSSLLRRLSGDAPRTSRRSASKGPPGSLNSRASSLYSYDDGVGGSIPPTSNPASFMSDSSVLHSAQRSAPPYQPPPLTPLNLVGYNESATEKSKQLTRQLAEEIRLLVPPRLQLTEQWNLVYSLEQDGVSLATLYKKCAQLEASSSNRGGYVLVIKDGNGGIFGAYLSDAPKSQSHYYGTGECFLWRSAVLSRMKMQELDLSSLPPPPSEDTSHYNVRQSTLMSPTSKNGFGNGNGNGGRSGMSTPDRIRFKAFPYSGMNDYMLFCQADYLSVGGGDGHYGLWLDDSLDKGISESCPTFGNEPLSDEGKKFEVMGVEMWHIG